MNILNPIKISMLLGLWFIAFTAPVVLAEGDDQKENYWVHFDPTHRTRALQNVTVYTVATKDTATMIIDFMEKKSLSRNTILLMTSIKPA